MSRTRSPPAARDIAHWSETLTANSERGQPTAQAESDVSRLCRGGNQIWGNATPSHTGGLTMLQTVQLFSLVPIRITPFGYTPGDETCYNKETATAPGGSE
jgi:hypothetical protein